MPRSALAAQQRRSTGDVDAAVGVRGASAPNYARTVARAKSRPFRHIEIHTVSREDFRYIPVSWYHEAQQRTDRTKSKGFLLRGVGVPVRAYASVGEWLGLERGFMRILTLTYALSSLISTNRALRRPNSLIFCWSSSRTLLIDIINNN